MQLAVTLLLFGGLSLAMMTFAAAGLIRIRRTGRLARKVQQMGMRFSEDDPFNAACRYSEFALISGGHSCRARNVTFGQVAGRPVRVFDFQQEAGHGTRRVLNRYEVLVAETGQALPSLLMWNLRDAGDAPLLARQCRGRVAGWSYCGDDALAESLSRTCGGLGAGASVQSCGSALMIAVPLRNWRQDYTGLIADAARVFQTLRDWLGPQRPPSAPKQPAAAK